jgi:hypothetical protein
MTRASEAVATLLTVVREISHFQAYRGSAPPRFAHEAEVEYAKILDYHGVPWLYEPRTFVLEEAEDGRILEAFTPDFYLPDQDLFVEVTVMKQSLVTRKNRKLRKLRQRYPEIRIKLFYKRDLERLAQRYGLKLAS